MKAIVLEEENKFIKKDLSYPESKPGHAIVKMLALGICGSDIHAYSGQQPMFSYPKVVGHEIAAEIVESELYQKGEIVTVYYNPSRPEESVLEPGFNPYIILIAAAGPFILLIVTILYRYAIQLESTSRLKLQLPD